MIKLNPEHIQAAIQYSNEIPFHKLTGIRLVELSEGYSRMELTIKDDLRNSHGCIHGGVYASLLDACTCWALYPTLEEGNSMTTANLSVHDLDVINSGTVEAVGHLVRQGRSLAVCEGQVKAPDGRILAIGTATMVILKGKLPPLMLNGKPIPPKFIEVPDKATEPAHQ